MLRSSGLVMKAPKRSASRCGTGSAAATSRTTIVVPGLRLAKAATKVRASWLDWPLPLFMLALIWSSVVTGISSNLGGTVSFGQSH